MASCRRPKECEISRYRHGCDPPKTIQAVPSFGLKDQRPTSPVSGINLSRLYMVWTSRLIFVHKTSSQLRQDSTSSGSANSARTILAMSGAYRRELGTFSAG